MFQFDETPDSRQETSEPPGYTLVYKAVGEIDDAFVQYYAINATPTIVFRPGGALFRKNITRDPDGHGQYLVTVTYGKLDRTDPPVGSAAFSFSTQGATVNIKAAKAHVNSYPSSSPPDHKGAIGVTADGDVQGADIVIPALKLSYSFTHPQGVVTENFARLLASVTGRTNSSEFRGFEAGELLFLGASGSDGTQSEAAIQYDFAASSNETALTIGEITGIVKDGHHIAWIEFEDDVDSGKAIRPPKYVHVERVYDAFDFTSVFGWE